MKIQANNKAAYQLLHDGALALSEIQSYGIRIDIDYCIKTSKEVSRRIDRIEDQLERFSEIREWKRKYGAKCNLNSDDQLKWLLFERLGFEPIKLTSNENFSVDQSVLDKFDLPFLKVLMLYKRLLKTRDTYLKNIINETVNGYLHPFFNLNTVRTYRSSSSNINFQNQPIRMEDMKRLVRRAFIPRPGQRIGGIDYSGIEVKVSTCYHKDPKMLEYINDPTSDLHRDTALDIYILKDDEITKDIRWWGKSGFVFPQFYGDWWLSCAVAMWDAISHQGLKTKQGVPLREHLWDKGIKGLGTLDTKKRPSKNSFYAHVRDFENKFWNEWFPVYTQWKKDWVKLYEKRGYIDMFTGFRCSGVMGKNDVINYPVQGTAFHCLLWSLIRLHEWMKQEEMISKIIGQIHDEIVQDIHPDEMDPMLRRAELIMCTEIKNEWDWLIVPLTIDAEFAPVDASWYEVEEVKIGA